MFVICLVISLVCVLFRSWTWSLTWSNYEVRMKVFFFLLLSSRNIYGLCYYLGPERGVCSCGRCNCKEDYLGDNCGNIHCSRAAPKCLNPNTVSFCFDLNQSTKKRIDLTEAYLQTYAEESKKKMIKENDHLFTLHRRYL